MINPENIIILYKSTKNAIHMMYGSWDKKHNRENFLPFLGQFLPFYLTNNMKNQIFKKWKKCMEISSFYTSAPKIMIICYTVAEIQCVMDVMFIFHFGLFFVLLPPLRYHHFTYCNKNYNHMIQFLRCGARQMERWTNGWIDRQMDGRVNRWTDRLTDKQTNRWTDRQKKWHIEVSAPPKKILRRVF